MHSDDMTRVRSRMCREVWAFLISIRVKTFLRASERRSVFFWWWPADTSKSSSGIHDNQCPLSWLVNSRWTLILPSALMNPPESCASSSILVAQSLFIQSPLQAKHRNKGSRSVFECWMVRRCKLQHCVASWLLQACPAPKVNQPFLRHLLNVQIKVCALPCRIRVAPRQRSW